MARSTRSASDAGVQTVRTTLKRKKWSQTYLAGSVGCARQTIWSLLKGKPIDAELFMAVCSQLGLAETEIADASEVEAAAGEELPIDEQVRQLRKQVYPWIDERCGWMNVLSMTHRIGLGDIYTDVNILEKITGRKRLSLSELAEDCPSVEFERFGFSDLREVKRVPGLQAVDECQKLVILGKPGAGKTTFLKRVATQCNVGTFRPTLVPIFVTLKQFAETPNYPKLLAYITAQWANCQVTSPEDVLKDLLYAGRGLVLLDGLDEVAKADSQRVIDEIREFEERFHENVFALTCRVAAQEFKLEAFHEVEIADFDDQQIGVFVAKWFEQKDPAQTERVLRHLKENPRVRELATNPLLLTLLCLGFEEAGYFSDSRSSLYKEGLNVLLKRWDATRGIERDQVYRRLTPNRKEDLLSQLAYNTFAEGQYFFREAVAMQQISGYIANLPGAKMETEQLDLDSRAVLRSIAAQHGLLVERSQEIYSFSHLTFQEYFVAKEVVSRCNAYVPEDPTLQAFTRHVSEKRWSEVFLLVTEMLPNADCYLLQLKKHIDAWIAADLTLQKVLAWAWDKQQSIVGSYKAVALRALYLSPKNYPFISTHPSLNRPCSLDLCHSLDRSLSLDLSRYQSLDDLSLNRSLEDFSLDRFLSLDLDLSRSLALSHTLSNTLSLALLRSLSLSLKRSLASCLYPELQAVLQKLKDQLPDPEQNSKAIKQWWMAQSKSWSQELEAALIRYCNIGHTWPFVYPQARLFMQYLDANLLLVHCLNSDCYVSREVRQSIEDTLLLPSS